MNIFKSKEEKSSKAKLQQNGEDKQNKQEEAVEISESHDSNYIDNMHQNNQQMNKQVKANVATGILKEDFMSQYYQNQQQNEKNFNLKSQNQQETQSHKVNFNFEKNRNLAKAKSIVTNNNNDKNLLEMINLEVLQQSTQQIQYKFQAPYQLALIYITWIFFGFCFILRDIQDESSQNDEYKLYIISALLLSMGVVGLYIWKFIIIKRKVRLEEMTSFYRWAMMFFFLLSQILVVEAFALMKSISDSWVITVTIVQMSYIQSISRVNLYNLIYIGVSTVYLIVRFQFIVNWEWQSLCQSILICTIIVVHQEKLQVESQKQTKKMLSTNKKAHRLNNFYYNILGMIPEGVAIFDKNKSTIFCNKTIKDLFKCKKDQLNQIILGLSTNQQHNPSPQPSPNNNNSNNNNNQINGSTHNLQNMSQQYFKSTTINQQKEQQSQQQYFNQQQSLKHAHNNNISNNMNQTIQNNSNMLSNIQNNNNSNINDINSLINYPENIKDEVSILINQQSNQQQSNLNSGSSRLIQYKNENNIKSLNTQNFKRQSNELTEQIQVESDKKTQKSKHLDQQKSILTPSFKGPETLSNQADNSNNPTFSKIQTKELPSPIDSRKDGKIPSIEEQSSPAAILRYNNNLLNNQLTSSLPSPQKSNVIVNSNLIYGSNNPNSYQYINENQSNLQDYVQSPTNQNQQGYQFDQKGMNSNNYMEVCKSIRGVDSNSNNEQLNFEGSVVSNNQLINQSNYQQVQQQQSSPKKSQSLNKKPSHPIINASSHRNEDEEESDIDIFNNYIYQQEGQKIFKRRLFTQKKSNDIIQRETKVGDILQDLFNEVIGGRNNSQNQNTGNNQNNTNNLDPTIQSPNNQNAISFLNNNSNTKEIPLTPSSIKKPQFDKSKTFFSQMNKNTNLGYMQFQEDMIKAQVKWKDQIFVLKFLLLELETSENNSEIFILVLVDPLWQEYYNKKMEEVQKYKMKMFASLSHELRTPLNCTISMLEGLEQFIPDPQLIDDYLYPALHSQKLLLNQINDILDFAQIDSGKFKYTFVDFNLEKLLQDCQTLIQMQANVKSIELQLIYDTRLNLQVKSDQNRIRQILLNFLSNSLKFTPENGTIRIIAEPMFINETNRVQKYIRLAVQDTGIGMKPETVQNIFNAFNKTEYESEGMNSQGCGLGLAISQSISKGLCAQNTNNTQLNILSEYLIPQNQIGIQVESVYSQGSTFSFIIQDMNPKPLLSPQYTHNNSYTHSVLPLDMINEEEMANSYISVKNENPENITTNTQKQQQQQQAALADLSSKNPKDDKELSLMADSACINDGSTYQNKVPQYMELGAIIDVHYRNNDLVSSNNGSPLHKPSYIQQAIIQLNNQNNTQMNSPSNQNKVGDNPQYIQSLQSTSTSTQQSINKLNQNTNQINNLNSVSPNNQIQKAISNNPILVTIEPEEQFKNNLPTLNDQRNSQSSQNNQNRINIVYDNQMRFSQSNSTTNNNHSNSSIPSKITPSSSRLTSNLSRTLTNKSLTKMTSSAIGFNGYHSKSNLNEIEGAKLMNLLQQHIENSVCENKCASILVVDDNQFNILALSRMLQQFFNVPIDKAFDGKQAYEKICNRYQQNKQNQLCTRCLKYEIVFMDIEMPILNGYEVMKELTDFYSEHRLSKDDIPYIVACTAHGGDQEQVRAKNSGFDDYISKPIMKNDIQKLLCDWYYQTHSHTINFKIMQQQGSLMAMNTMNEFNEINQKLI